MASRRPSPSMLKPSMARRTKGIGKRSHGAKRMARTLETSCNSTPQLVSGGRRPKPSQLKATSARIMPGIINVAMTMMWLMAPGIRCRNIIRRSLAPKLWAASTYSRSRKESTNPLTCRASPPQRTKARMRVSMKYTRMGDHWGGMAAAKAIKMGMSGKAPRNSVVRWTNMSIAPP